MKSNNKNHASQRQSSQKYVVSHITTFGFGEEYGLCTITDGLNHLEEIKRSEKIDPQEMLLGFVDDRIEFRFLDTGDLIEYFSMKFVSNQYAYVADDETDEYNNLLIFVVNPDRSKNSLSPEEMHVFQCISHPVKDVLEVLQNGLDKVRKQELPYGKVLPKTPPKTPPKLRTPADSRRSTTLSTSGRSRESSSQTSPSRESFTEISPNSNVKNENPTGSQETSKSCSPKTTLESSAISKPSSRRPSLVSTITAERISTKSTILSSKMLNLSGPNFSVINDLPITLEKSIIYPKYLVEHIATFDYGLRFGLPDVQSGVQKLIDQEQSRSFWVQKVILRMKKDAVLLQDLDKKIIGEFSKRSLSNVFSCYSETPRDMYDNLLIFVVNEVKSETNSTNSRPQLHIFQCASHSAKDIAKQIRYGIE